MNEKQESTLTESLLFYTSTAYNYRGLIQNLLKNKPKKALELSVLYVTDFQKFRVALGKTLVEILKHLSPDLHAIVNVLLSTNEGTNQDELYEAIHPVLDSLLNKTIGDYGVSLKDIGLLELLTESYLKSDVLPIFIVVRDIPKFCKSIKEKNFLKIINDIRAQLLTHLETDLHSEIRKYLVVGKDGLYEIKAHDPALVSQIKKILNALAYADKVLTFINSLDLNPDNGFRLGPLFAKKGDKKIEFLTEITWYLAIKDSIVGNLLHYELNLEPEELDFIKQIELNIKYAREAQSSLLEVDIPTGQIFGEELKMLRGVINSLQTWTVGGTKVFLEKQLGSPTQLAKTVGDYTGVFIDQLKPHEGKTDYTFLTRQLGLLPGYLDQLTQWIYSYGTDQQGVKLALTDANTEVFKNSAIRLFFELSTFEDLWFWQKGVSMLFPIRSEGVTLSQGAYQQVLRVNEAIGEMVAHQLLRVKNELFTKILCETEKGELYLGFDTGVSTKPLMLRLNELYQTLVFYAGYLVDLKEKHPGLLQLDNTSLLTNRLQNILQQKNECQLKVTNALNAKKNLEVFSRNFDAGKTEQERADLKKLYQSFKHYVIEYNPRLSVLIDTALSTTTAPARPLFSAHDLQLMNQEVEKLCDKEIVTFGCYLKLADTRLSEIPKQIKGKLYPLDSQKKHSFLIVNELGWLVEHKALGSSVVEGDHPFIKDLTSLAPESRAALYNYHSIRALTLKHIDKELGIFLEQLPDTTWLSNRKKMNLIVERYRVLQPYFVDSMKVTLQNNSDKSFVGLLNELSKNTGAPKKYIIILDVVTAGMKELKQQISVEIARSESRHLLFKFAHEKIREEKTVLFNNEPLTLESELVKRQDKWIRHQRLSRAADDMNHVLLNLLTQFDPCLKLSAVVPGAGDMVPFPEMERDLDALTMPTQVSWAKRLLNVVYYINSNFKYLESLDRDISKKAVTHYFLKGPLVEGIYQIKPFLELTKAYQTLMELMQEPAGHVFMDTLKGGYAELMSAWGAIQPMYFASSIDVRVDNPAPVKSAGLWYSILTEMVIPEHLTQISSGRSYTAAHAKQAQRRAKEVAQYIEDITIQFQASHYLNLLLKSPYILFILLPELYSSLITFREVTHDITVEHLRDIQSTLYKILIETDDFELKFGLRVGRISIPAKLILDKIFNSFIEPLGISLQESAQLVQETASFQLRLKANADKKEETIRILESEKAVFASLDQFLKSLEQIKAKIEAKQAISSAERAQFREQYWAEYPLLQSQQSHYALSLDQRDKSIELDKFCDECFKEQLSTAATWDRVYHYTSLNDVMYLVKHVHAARKGNINSVETRLGYLSAQARAIGSAKQQFVKKEGKEALTACISYAIDAKIKLICKKTSQSVYLEAEFENNLFNNLSSKKEELLKKVSGIHVRDLEQTIDGELQNQYQLFTQTEGLQLRHLDCIVTKINNFLSYCEKEKLSPLYENTDPITGTLWLKVTLLNRLNDIAHNSELTLKERIDAITEEANKPQFETILLSHDSHYKLEWNTLTRVFLDLFQSIFNFFGLTYRPKDNYNALDNAIKTEHQNLDKPSLAKAGFFSKESGKNTVSDKSRSATKDVPVQLNKPSLP